MEHESRPHRKMPRAPEWNDSVFFKWAGLRIVEAKDGRAEIELSVEDHHRGGGGTRAVNGGIVAYLLDGLLGAAVGSTWDDSVRGQVTVSLNIDYLRMLRAEKRVTGSARVMRAGRSTAFVRGEVMDESGTVCVAATGIYHLFREER